MVMAPISITFVQMVTWRLLKWSANQPPVMLKSTKGMENKKVTTETKVSRSSLPRPMPTIMASSRLRRMLSLYAPWNWVAINAQNPRSLR